MRHSKKWEGINHIPEKREATETVRKTRCQSYRVKAVITNTLTVFKKAVVKEIKEGMIRMLHLIENIIKE